MLISALVALLPISPPLPRAWAETDLCTFGWGNDVHAWVVRTKEIEKVKGVYCGKKARKDAERAAAVIAKALAHDGYEITVAPHVQEIELDRNPSLPLSAAIQESKCGGKNKILTSVLTVCLSVKEAVPKYYYGHGVPPPIESPTGPIPKVPPNSPNSKDAPRPDGQRPAL